MAKAKKHHLVPKCYLKAWSVNKNSVLCFNARGLNPCVEPLNLKNSFYENNFHTIRPGMLGFKDYQDLILDKIKGYEVYLNDERIAEDLIWNYASEINNWVFVKNGIPLCGKDERTIKQALSMVRDTSIEENWSEDFENDWQNLKDLIVRWAQSEHKPLILPFNLGKLIQVIVAMDWRGLNQNQQLNESFDSTWNLLIGLLGKDATNHVQELDKDRNEFKHSILLKQYLAYFEGRGCIAKQIDLYCKLLAKFIYSERGELFTSDNPSFFDSEKHIHFFPVSPFVGVELFQSNDGIKSNWSFREADKNDISLFNDAVKRNAVAKVILPPSYGNN